MQSARTSRVCIVVLEEVEEDESPTTSTTPPPPRPKSSPDRKSHHAPRRVLTHQDHKVRAVLLYPVKPHDEMTAIKARIDLPSPHGVRRNSPVISCCLARLEVHSKDILFAVHYLHLT